MTVLGGGTLGGDQVTNVKPLRRGLCVLSCLPTLCDPVDYIACQAPLRMGFSRQEYWSGLSWLPPGSSRPRDQTRVFQVSCAGRQVLYH